MPRLKSVSSNLAAFLDMLAFSEGTANLGDAGYNVLVGGTLFNGYKDHPRIAVPLPRLGIKSTAAGRYQILARFFDAYKRTLGLPDFGPESQDRIAVRMISEQGALPDIAAGRFEAAVLKCRNIWASLPGAGYGQHENTMGALAVHYVKAGGTAV